MIKMIEKICFAPPALRVLSSIGMDDCHSEHSCDKVDHHRLVDFAKSSRTADVRFFCLPTHRVAQKTFPDPLEQPWSLPKDHDLIKY